MILFFLLALQQSCCGLFFFFFNDTATTEIYTLSLHDALPIPSCAPRWWKRSRRSRAWRGTSRSEEHTSELQSRRDLVCRLLLEKKKTNNYPSSDGKKKNTRPEKSRRN